MNGHAPRFNIDAFSPTDPENSPGIGHPKMDVHAPQTQ